MTDLSYPPGWAHVLIRWAASEDDVLDFEGVEVPEKVQEVLRRAFEPALAGTQEPPGVGLSEEERDQIRDAFDAWGHDYGLLYPVVERIVAARVAEVERERSALDADIERMHGAHERTKQSLRRMEQRADKAESDLADLRAGLAALADRWMRYSRTVPELRASLRWESCATSLRDLLDERQGGDDER